MMRTLNSLVTGAAFVFTAGLMACTVDPGDPFETLTTANQTLGDGDGDMSTETGTAEGDGDGDMTGDGDGDGEPGDGDGDGDGDTGCPAGTLGCPCDAGACDAGLECDMDNMCGLPGGDGDGDGDGDPGPGTYDPMMCAAPAQVLGIEGLDGNFCSAPCMVDADCPAGPPGTTAACALVTMMGGDPEFCALICDPAADPDACPEGSSCKEVPNQPGVGLCTYP